MALEFTRVALAGPLWTVAEAKTKQLRLRDAETADVQEKLDTAEDAILAYLGPAVDPTWTPTTAPPAVKHAILLLTAHYYEHRGDDIDKTADAALIWGEVQQLLGRHRDPTLG